MGCKLTCLTIVIFFSFSCGPWVSPCLIVHIHMSELKKKSTEIVNNTYIVCWGLHHYVLYLNDNQPILSLLTEIQVTNLQCSVVQKWLKMGFPG